MNREGAIQIEQLDARQAQADIPSLVLLLQDAVDSGASVGFLPPLEEQQAQQFWQKIVADLAEGSRVLLVARADGGIVGTVQLVLAGQPNAAHRAEVQRLLVHSRARRRGIGTQLMTAIEAVARQLRRTTLVLDTRLGDGSETLYTKIGYTRAGTIPNYARSADGTLHTTVLFYRLL